MAIKKNNFNEGDDVALWESFRAGSQSSFNIIVEKYFKSVFDYGIRFSRDREFLKDCVQEVFLELWSKRDKIKSTSYVKWYLFKSVRLRIFREQIKWSRADTLEDDYHFTVEFNIESSIIEETTAKDLKDKIAKVLNDLPPRQREAVYLRFYEGLDFNEISKVMNLSKQSVHNLLQKAYNNFRTEWTAPIALVIFFSYCKSVN